MKNKKLYIIIVLLIVVNIFQFILFIGKKEKIKNLTPWKQIVLNNPKIDNCNSKEKDFTITWKAMEPLLKNSQKIKIIENYYSCNNKVNRWDIIVYKNLSKNNEIVRQIKALPWDIIKFENNKIIINWDFLKNSKKEEYIFDTKQIKYMNMYILDSKLQKWSFFAFWDNINDNNDSRTMWWLWIKNFKWKIVLK